MCVCVGGCVGVCKWVYDVRCDCVGCVYAVPVLKIASLNCRLIQVIRKAADSRTAGIFIRDIRHHVVIE